MNKFTCMQFDRLIDNVLKENLVPELKKGFKQLISITITYNEYMKNSSCSEPFTVFVKDGMGVSQWDEQNFLRHKGSDFEKAFDAFIDCIYEQVVAKNKQETLDKAVQTARQMEHLRGIWVVGCSIYEGQMWLGVEIDAEQYRTDGIIDAVKSATNDVDISDW